MKLNYKRIMCVGLAFFLISAFWQAYDTIIPKILTDKFGLNQAVSGAVMALDNILALFMLPLFGTLSDKCKSKRGKRTPFILIGTLCAVIAFVSMSFADNAQLRKIEAVSPKAENAQVVLYEADLDIKHPDTGEIITVCDKFSKEDFVAIEMYDENDDVTSDYTNYVVPARQAYARMVMGQNPSTLIVFILVLLMTLLSMATFRSPAVALMPDVTVKPLRSKANSIINLMGAAGGIIVLVLGMVFKTGKPINAIMSYTPFFCVIAGMMLVALFVFKLTVNEPKLAAQMEEDTKKYGIEDTPDEETANSGSRKLSRKEFISLILILASVALWYMGYNAVTSKYSVYASTVLNLDYNLTLMIATGAAIVCYVPAGMLATKFGRKKTILAGIILLGSAFFIASFARNGSPAWMMNGIFIMAGMGWATINVNSYPMVVELSRGGDVGKYTGFYYTASMAAQTITPVISGAFMEIKMTSLFVYATIMVFSAFITMFFVKHGDAKQIVAGEGK
jgi:MFS family permease